MNVSSRLLFQSACARYSTIGVGIRVASGQTKVVVIKNTTAGNTANSYAIPAGNDVGPWGQAATATSPWANIQN